MYMNIHSLMREFARIEGSEVGQGPRHPANSRLELASEIDSFFHVFPFLRRDQGYVDFLECYGGAFIEESSNIVDLYGFLSISTHIVREDGFRLDDKGYFSFCTVLLNSTQEFGFAFDATQERRSGVYCWIINDRLEVQYHWCNINFLDWLNTLILSKGRLLYIAT